MDSGSENDRMSSVVSDHTLSDTDSVNSYSDILMSSESDDSVTYSGIKPTDLPTKDCILSTFSAFLIFAK